MYSYLSILSFTHNSLLIFCSSIYILPSSRASSSIKSTTCNSRFFFACCATRYWKSANIISCRTLRGMRVNTFEFASKGNNEIVSSRYSFLSFFVQLWVFTWSFVFSLGYFWHYVCRLIIRFPILVIFFELFIVL